jgi:hypothetical protein
VEVDKAFRLMINTPMLDGIGDIRGSKHIKGELVRIEGHDYFIHVKGGTPGRD